MFNSRRRYYFLTIADQLNITRAAEQLIISQPSLTQYLNKLESDLGAKLIDRKYTPLRLTPAGQIYYDYLKDALSREQTMRSSIAAITEGEKMPLRIGVPIQKSLHLTETFLPVFTEAYPQINYSIWEGVTPSVRSRVLQNELDIGFCHTFLDQDDDCEVVPLRKERVVIIMNRENHLIGDAEATLENPLQIDSQLLNGERFYEMSPDTILHNVEVAQLEKFDIHPGKRVMMTHFYSRIADIIAHPDSGFAFMPDYIFQESFPKSILPNLAVIRISEDDFYWYFSMLRRKNKNTTPEAQLFWNCIARLADI